MLRNVIQRNRNYLFKHILADIKHLNFILPKTGICSNALYSFNRVSYTYQYHPMAFTCFGLTRNTAILRHKTTVKTTESHKKESSVDEQKQEIKIKSLTRGEKLKKAVKEYGSTVIVFHVGISLISLGTSYLLVSSGLDISKVFEMLGLQEWLTKSEAAANAGTFAVAYAVHKVFAPVRITITLACVPLIVRYLRRIGFLKK